MSPAREAAMCAADELLGTAGDMPAAYEKWGSDPLFCETFSAQIFCCEMCGWWVEQDENDGNENCEDCV